MQSTPHRSSLSIMQSTGLGRVFLYEFFLKDGKRLKVQFETMQSSSKKSVQLDSNKTGYSGKLELKFNMSTY